MELHNKFNPPPLQFHTNVLSRSTDEMLPYNSSIQVFVVAPHIYSPPPKKKLKNVEFPRLNAHVFNQSLAVNGS
jgi:hypothetical protein